MLYTMELIFAFVFGISVGSFLNVLIYRIPRELPFAGGTSLCPACGKRIMPYDLIPIISYILLKRKCRYCKAVISVKYPLIEALTGFVAILVVLKFNYTLAALLYFFVFIILTVIAFIDIEHMIIPDGLIIALVVLSLLNAALSFFKGDLMIISRVAGFFAISLPMLVITCFVRDAFGGGDIKLIAVCGFLLGVKLILLTGFIAILLGGINGICIKYIWGKKNTSHIAFGQYICIGAFISALFGEEIISLYLSLWSL